MGCHFSPTIGEQQRQGNDAAEQGGIAERVSIKLARSDSALAFIARLRVVISVFYATDGERRLR